MPFYNGKKYVPQPGSPLMYAAADGELAPPEAVEQFIRMEMARAEIKPAGRRKKHQTVGKRRLDMWEGGMSFEEIARHDCRETDVIRHSIAKARERRQRQSGQ